MTAIRQLARAAGIDPDYTGWRGQRIGSSDEALVAALRALAKDLGIAFERGEDADTARDQIERERWNELVPPVVVGWDGSLVVPFAVLAGSDGPWEIEVTTEGGRTVTASGKLFDLPADAHAVVSSSGEGVMHCIRRATIWLDGELGYCRVEWRVAGARGEAFGIAAPTRAYGGPGENPRRWGVFAPVYGLASTDSGECGDLGTLRRLFDQVQRRGGRYVATLPILAATLDEPCNFSPYSPISRLFWNELYLDLAAVAADAGASVPRAPAIATGTTINYRAQYHWRRSWLDPLATALAAHPTHGPAIDTWARATGTYDYAAFRAIGEQYRVGWSRWPAMWRDAVPVVDSHQAAIALGADGARVTSHVVAQWAMQRQLDALEKHPVDLYLDLPVGVSCDAYEVWRDRHLFLTQLAAGAPPDALFLGGQNWGLPPLSPIALRRDHYRYLIRSIRHHMAVSGMLRIDHVMGLFRLYCVPEGHPATDGIYLRYQADEILAILTLESRRAECALVGEDLGTVPEQVRPAMARHGMFRLHVGQWFMPAHVGQAPAPSPRESVASLNTHDTATFAGWWRGVDIDDRKDLGLITADQDSAERVERDESKRALLAFAQAKLEVGDPLTEVERAMVAATTDLAVGPAEVVLVSLDDLALDPIPHNVPGTVDERPNWRRRVTGWADALDDTHAPPAATACTSAIVAARKA